MNRKSIFIILSIPIAAAILLSVLVMANDTSTKKSGFSRKWLNIGLLKLNELQLEEQLSSISGVTEQYIYFLEKNSRRLIYTNLSLTTVDTLNLRIPVKYQKTNGFFISVDSPSIYAYDYNQAITFNYRINDTLATITKLNTNIFTKACKLSDTSIVVRGFDSLGKIQIFQKIDTKTGMIQKTFDAFNSKNDAGLSTDGVLCYDKRLQRVIYVLHYENKFICMDTNLNKIYAGFTIDTINTNPIATQKIIDKKKTENLMPSVPLRVINKECVANNGYLYILSTLRADNESPSEFRNNSQIDVYSIDNGKYIGSFYIPNINRQKISTFKIYNNILIAITKNSIATFSLLDSGSHIL